MEKMKNIAIKGGLFTRNGSFSKQVEMFYRLEGFIYDIKP